MCVCVFNYYVLTIIMYYPYHIIVIMFQSVSICFNCNGRWPATFRNVLELFQYNRATPSSFSNARRGESVYKDQSPQGSPARSIFDFSKSIKNTAIAFSEASIL